jgi:hypothetical protein
VRGQQHRHPGARAGAEFVAQQVSGLGRPVRQRHGGQFDAFTIGIVVIGDAGAFGVGREQRGQKRVGQVGHQLTRAIN